MSVISDAWCAGSAIERMGGRGAMINAYIGDKKPSQDIASSFNFPADYVKAIPVSLATLRDYNGEKNRLDRNMTVAECSSLPCHETSMRINFCRFAI